MAQSVSTLTKLQRQSFPGDDKDPATIYDLRKIQDSIANSLDPVVQFLTQFQSDQTNVNASLALYQLLSLKDATSGYVGRDANNRLSIAATNLTEVVPASPVANRDYAGMFPHPISSTALSGATTTISLPGDMRYSTILAHIRYLVPTTNGDDIWSRINDGGGINSGAGNYKSSYPSGGVSKSFAGGGASDTKWIIAGATTDHVANTASEGMSAFLFLIDPGEASHHKHIIGATAFLSTGGGLFLGGLFMGSYVGSTNALTQIQFLCSTGNITSGTCDLYGVLAV